MAERYHYALGYHCSPTRSDDGDDLDDLYSSSHTAAHMHTRRGAAVSSARARGVEC